MTGCSVLKTAVTFKMPPLCVCVWVLLDEGKREAGDEKVDLAHAEGGYGLARGTRSKARKI